MSPQGKELGKTMCIVHNVPLDNRSEESVGDSVAWATQSLYGLCLAVFIWYFVPTQVENERMNE